MNERDWSGRHRGTTAEQQAHYAPLAWELMRAPHFHGKSYEHLLVEHTEAVALLHEYHENRTATHAQVHAEADERDVDELVQLARRMSVLADIEIPAFLERANPVPSVPMRETP